MTRVKGGTTALKHRKNVLGRAKGFRFGRSTKEREAREALFHAGNHAFAHRRDKKGDARRLWNVQINAGVRALGLTYSKLMGMLKTKNIELDRKVLAHLANKQPAAFAKVVEVAKQ
jgi:large subunit ribosomal protein L20